jgi:hypothetical protein
MHKFLHHGISNQPTIHSCGLQHHHVHTPWIPFRSIVCESRYFSIQHKKQRQRRRRHHRRGSAEEAFKNGASESEQSPTQRRGVEGLARLSRRANNAPRPSYIQRGRYPHTHSLLLTLFALFNKVALPTYRERSWAGCGLSERGKWKGGSSLSRSHYIQ